MLNENDPRKRLRAMLQAEDLVGKHLSFEERQILKKYDETLDKRQAKLETRYERGLNPDEETLLMQQTFLDIPGSEEAFDKRREATEMLERKLGNKRA